MTNAISGNHELVRLAESIARAAHDGQFRRDGLTPYIVHPKAVAERVESPEAKAAAWLHDVIEDTDWDAPRLVAAGIPETIADAVSALTKSHGVSYEDYLERVSKNVLSREVKIADMLANLADKPSRKQIVKYAKGLLFLHQD